MTRPTPEQVERNGFHLRTDMDYTPEQIALAKKNWEDSIIKEAQIAQTESSYLREGECLVCLEFVPLVWDHDHETGEPRAWLCSSCNSAEGFIKSSTAARRLAALIDGELIETRPMPSSPRASRYWEWEHLGNVRGSLYE